VLFAHRGWNGSASSSATLLTAGVLPQMVSVAQMQGHLMLYRADPFAAVSSADFTAQVAAATDAGQAERAEVAAELASGAEMRPGQERPPADAERRRTRVHRRPPDGVEGT